jgi:hypothetical protein
MKSDLLLFCCAITFLLLFGCSRSVPQDGTSLGSSISSFPVAHPEPLPTELRRIATADPLFDLREAIKRDDYRFIGIYGYTLFAPGINRNLPRGMVKPIEGTTDAISSKEQETLQRKATAYATAYNLALVQFQKTNKPSRPEILDR